MKKLAILSCLIVLGFAAGAPTASAYTYSNGYASYSSSNYRYSDYGRDSRSGFSVSGHYSYDSNGVATWVTSSNSRSSRNDYDYQDDRYNQDRYYDNNYNNGHSSNSSSCYSTSGRYRYDSNGVAYWVSSESSCR